MHYINETMTLRKAKTMKAPTASVSLEVKEAETAAKAILLSCDQTSGTTI